jgi:hypothetical protein
MNISNFLKIGRSRQIVAKTPNMIFHKISADGSSAVACGQTKRRTDTTKLIVAFQNRFAKTV